jgi:hypothetical protein
MLYVYKELCDITHAQCSYCGKTSLLKKTWECFKEELTGEELPKKWFFDKDKGGKTAKHLTA